MYDTFTFGPSEIIAMVFFSNPEELAAKARKVGLKAVLPKDDPYCNIYINGVITDVENFLVSSGFDFDDVAWV